MEKHNVIGIDLDETQYKAYCEMVQFGKADRYDNWYDWALQIEMNVHNMGLIPWTIVRQTYYELRTYLKIGDIINS